MTTLIDRAQFILGKFRAMDAPLRPPWSRSEREFLDRCTQCGECIRRCPTGILKTGRAAYPVVDFSAGECRFCGDCVDHCEPAALDRAIDPPWPIKASLDGASCLAAQRVECRACEDFCEPRAIRMRLRPGAAATPRIDTARCSGCGACVGACPTSAIAIRRPIEAAA